MASRSRESDPLLRVKRVQGLAVCCGGRARVETRGRGLGSWPLGRHGVIDAAVALRHGADATLDESAVDALLSSVATQLREAADT